MSRLQPLESCAPSICNSSLISSAVRRLLPPVSSEEASRAVPRKALSSTQIRAHFEPEIHHRNLMPFGQQDTQPVREALFLHFGNLSSCGEPSGGGVARSSDGAALALPMGQLPAYRRHLLAIRGRHRAGRDSSILKRASPSIPIAFKATDSYLGYVQNHLCSLKTSPPYLPYFA